MTILIIASIAFLLILVLSAFPISKQKEISGIVSELSLLECNDKKEEYAIKHNILFFKSIRTIWSYLFWLLFIKPKINHEKLLELADLGVQKWEDQLYSELTSLESKRFPGLIKPLVESISKKFLTYKQEQLIVVNLGCGGMEPERQVIEKIKATSLTSKKKYIFIGIDSSKRAWNKIYENTNQLDIQREKVDIKYAFKATDQNIVIRFVEGDVIKLLKTAATNKIDFIFSSKFMHHLTESDKKHLYKLSREKAKEYWEYDDCSTFISYLLPLTTAWTKPVLFNGAILSLVRQPRLKDLRRENKTTKNIRFYNPPGAYLKVLKGHND